jgi:hypothetical protein
MIKMKLCGAAELSQLNVNLLFAAILNWARIEIQLVMIWCLVLLVIVLLIMQLRSSRVVICRRHALAIAGEFARRERAH